MILAVGNTASGELGGGVVTEAILDFIRRGIKDSDKFNVNHLRMEAIIFGREQD